MDAETIVTPDVQVAPPDPPDMEAVRAYFSALQVDLTNRVRSIESFLGFTEGVEALAVRVAKLEAFTGIK